MYGKLVLAVLSASSYWLIDALFTDFEWDTTFVGHFAWQSQLVAVIFGALVMAPYTAASRIRWLRMPAMCAASALIYFYATEFVVDGPFRYDTLTPFLISGGSAALLVGLAVAMLAPRRIPWRLPALCLVAGVVGGAAFAEAVWLGSNFELVGGHLVWQVLVCLALHFGLRRASA